MGWTVSSSGTVTPTVGTPSTLVTDTTNASYCFLADLVNLPAQVTVEIILNTTILSGGASRQVWKASVTGPVTNPIIESPFVPSDQSLVVTLNQLTGTAAAFPWKLLRS